MARCDVHEGGYVQFARNALVAGGTGLVGTELLKLLAEELLQAGQPKRAAEADHVLDLRVAMGVREVAQRPLHFTDEIVQHRLTQGEAEAEIIFKKGEAEAKAMNVKAEAYQEYNQAAVVDKLITGLPEIVRALASPLAKVDKITVRWRSDCGARRLA